MLFPQDNSICLLALDCILSVCMCVSTRMPLPYIDCPEGKFLLSGEFQTREKVTLSQAGQVVLDQTLEQEIHGEPLGTQEKTASGERRRGGRHWLVRRLRHLSLSDLGMRRKNENNKTERERGG